MNLPENLPVDQRLSIQQQNLEIDQENEIIFDEETLDLNEEKLLCEGFYTGIVKKVKNPEKIQSDKIYVKNNEKYLPFGQGTYKDQ